MTIQDKLSSLATQLSAPGWASSFVDDFVVIKTNLDNGMPQVEWRSRWWNATGVISLPWSACDYLSQKVYTEEYRKECADTVDFFYELFNSERRINMVSRRHYIGLEEKKAVGMPLSRQDIQTLFLGLAEVRMEDVEELLKEASGRPTTLRHLSEDETEDFYDQIEGFNENNILEIDKKTLDAIWEILAPFPSYNSYREIFLNNLPHISEIGRCGEGREGLRNRVYMLYHLKLAGFKKEWQWMYRVSKKVMNLKIPGGVIIPHYRGYYAVSNKIEKSGAVIVFLRSLGRAHQLASMVFYLGTQFDHWGKLGLESKAGVFTTEIASRAANATLENMQEILYNPDNGFCRGIEGEHFKAVGFSQGGALAMLHAVMIANARKITRVFSEINTICSAGVSLKTMEDFHSLSEQLPVSSPIHVNHFQELYDVVHESGDGRIGYKCDSSKVKVKLTVIIRGEVPYEDLNAYLSSSDLPFFTAFRRTVGAFLGDHCRDTTTGSFSVIQISNQHANSQIDTLLYRPGSVYEKMRTLKTFSYTNYSVTNEEGGIKETVDTKENTTALALKGAEA